MDHKIKLRKTLSIGELSRQSAPNIEWLLKQGRQMAVSAKLANKLNYLWRSCTGELSEQNDQFRLIYALETVKDMHWITDCLESGNGPAGML